LDYTAYFTVIAHPMDLGTLLQKNLPGKDVAAVGSGGAAAAAGGGDGVKDEEEGKPTAAAASEGNDGQAAAAVASSFDSISFLVDLRTIFHNALFFNEAGSGVHRWV
jgi:hypothetical protein